MRIGFDLDKVFINTPPFIPDSVIEKLYRKQSAKKLTYRIPSKPEQMIRQFSHLPFFRPPMQKNIEFLQKLKKENHTLFLISSRFGFLQKQTETIIREYHLAHYFTEVIFNFNNEQPHVFKKRILEKITVNRYVDDDFYLLSYLAPLFSKTKFYWLNPEKDKKIDKNLFAIMHLSDILE